MPNGLEVDVKPWVVIMVTPALAVYFFDDYVAACEFASQQAAEHRRTVVATAIAVFGPRNGVGVDESPKVD